MRPPNCSAGLVRAWLILVGAFHESPVSGGLGSGPADLGWVPLCEGDSRASDWSSLALATKAETT